METQVSFGLVYEVNEPNYNILVQTGDRPYAFLSFHHGYSCLYNYVENNETFKHAHNSDFPSLFNKYYSLWCCSFCRYQKYK